jgi:DNA-binding transcriptional ArsR family regulator
MTTYSLQHPIPDPVLELIAERFRVFAEPMRIRLLDGLYDGEATVGELVEATGASQQNVSRHLRVLLDAGLVAREQRGNCAFYSIADESVFRICEEVCGGLQERFAELEAVVEGAAAR